MLFYLFKKRLPNGVAFSTLNEEGKYDVDQLNLVFLVN